MARITPLTTQASGYDGATHQIEVLWTDLEGVADNTAKAVDFATTANAVGAEATCEFISMEVRRPFSGGTVVANTLSVGDSGSATKYMAAKQICEAHASDVKRLVGGTTQQDLVTEIRLTFNAPGAGKNLDEYTDGQVLVRVRIVNNVN
jgi:hypothetical protein